VQITYKTADANRLAVPMKYAKLVDTEFISRNIRLCQGHRLWVSIRSDWANATFDEVPHSYRPVLKVRVDMVRIRPLKP
jgi:hypothetical protein